MIVNEIYLVTVTNEKTNSVDQYFCFNRSENIFSDVEKLQNEYETRHKATWRTDFKFEYKDVTKDFMKALQQVTAKGV
jgi:hypothetical protein